MRSALAAAWLLGLGVPAAAGDFQVHGILSGRGFIVDSPRSWIDGGFGRLTEGAGPDDPALGVRGAAHLGLDFRHGEHLRVHVHGTARTEPDAAGGRRAGLSEAFVSYRREFHGPALRLKAGLFFPQTSRENVDPLWASPYTITLSALNTWIGEEVRLIGLEPTLSTATQGGSTFSLAGSAFVGADTAGALLSWRGWALGDRLSTVGETVPLPALRSLLPRGGFADQRDDGTRPIDELDGRPGYQVRGRWDRRDVASVSLAWFDNRGDEALHAAQYAWRTRFGQVGFDWHPTPWLDIASEAIWGRSRMGPRAATRVDLDFAAGYALASFTPGPLRLTARYDRFRNTDRDGTAEDNGESGHALTGALFYAPRAWLRIGAEWVELRADRKAAAASGFSADTNARRLQGELRLRF
jgi:hypothetical protein